MTDFSLAAALQQLVDALDRRMPRLERASEMDIAADAALLRREATVRLEAMRRAARDRAAYDMELAKATMTDDGGAWASA